MNSSAIKLQLASFLGQLAKMLETQSATIDSMQETLVDIPGQAIDEEKLITLGAFISWSIIETDWAVSEAAEMVNRALSPLDLEPMPSGHHPRFQPSPGINLSDALPEILERNARQVKKIRETEQELLAISDKQLRQSYPKHVLNDFSQSWEKQFQEFFRE